jgi:uncharacterized protein
MSAVVETVSTSTEPKSIAERVSAIVWNQVLQDLDAQGNAKINRILTADECQSLSELYEKDDIFRSTVVMQRHGFGRGEYRYFKYPLPDLISSLRSAIYPHLVRIANRWNEAMHIDLRYPEQLADFIERCHQAGQKKPTPLMLRYRREDYNCLHQDLYGEHVFSAPAHCPVVRTEYRFHRWRVRDDRTTAAHAVATDGRIASTGRCGSICG